MKRHKQIRLLILIILFANQFNSNAQHLKTGYKLQKSVGMYTESGICAEYCPFDSIQLYIGACFMSTRLGSAFMSNALKQDNYIGTASYYFLKNSKLKPFVGSTCGITHIDYGNEIFDMLPNNTFTLTVLSGIEYSIIPKLLISGNIGYNVFTGDGIKKIGTIMPIIAQFSLYYFIF